MEELDELFEDDGIFEEPIGKPNVSEEPIKIDEDIFDIDDPIKSDKQSVLETFLESKGLKDAKVKVIEEDNTEKEVSFFELSEEDQLEVLNSLDAKEVFNDNNTSFLQYLQENNLTVDEYLEKYKDAILSELEQSYIQSYEIDAYSDNELFLLDLKNKFELSDEELAAELEKELKNEPLFKKKVDSIRAEYKKLEDLDKQAKQQAFEDERNERFQQFTQNMVDVAIKTPEFYGIELEDSDKEEVLSYLLTLDENGTSDFYKDLNKPERLYEAAWFLKYGKAAFDALKDAYESEIARLKKDNKIVVRSSKKGDSTSIFDLE